jgi:hypothetical protein
MLARWAPLRLFAGASAAPYIALLVLTSCDDLPEEECMRLRSAAFDLLNEPHPCATDRDCMLSPWPGCAKPFNARSAALMGDLQKQFDKGSCVEPVAKCDPPLSMLCDRNLCAFRQRGKQP